MTLCLFLYLACPFSSAQDEIGGSLSVPKEGTLDAPQTTVSGGGMLGTVSGTVLDQSGAVMVGAHVRLDQGSQSQIQDAQTGSRGEFSFAKVVPGDFSLTITYPGFRSHVFTTVLLAGQAYLVPPIVLTVEHDVTQVSVKISSVDVAQAQVQEQEKQRIFSVIPNFYVTYIHDAVPLTTGQKFHLAWKSTTDPFTPVGIAILAGAEQAADALEGYGQGAQGYAKRFGASYADVVAGTFIGSAILPSLLKQDPRYFYKGTGPLHSRILYAIGSPVFCKGDNGRWQPNYSNLMGAVAAGGISSLYYPSTDRTGSELLGINTAIRVAETSFEGVLQEFLIPHLTPRFRKLPHQNPANVPLP
jgi:Carboxypeptidase regulatory-like domain